MWKRFTKRPTGEEVLRPVAGAVIPLEQVPDPLFAQKTLGDGFAVRPTDGTFCAPVSGQLLLVAKTLHAFAIRTDAGAEVLVHIGIDTVALKGDGFEALRAQGDTVAAGDPVIRCDLAAQEARVPSMITPVIVTNGTAFRISAADPRAAAGAPVAVITPA